MEALKNVGFYIAITLGASMMIGMYVSIFVMIACLISFNIGWALLAFISMVFFAVLLPNRK